ncbi:adenylate/guanylate cyclase domain-containing protein [Streptomyces sp. NPDC057273]|uniref:adenylate/guanylate cyclase domain-containing protein n=1 Tax=Streptomyces sp. NPDC057273 TaxID=3346080 RepID=UPI003637B70A
MGSTALSGALDAETLRSVTLRWFDLMRLRIEEQGGTVEKFIGDAVMAVFGVPTVREDDARRAITAALAMREALTGLNARLDTTFGVRLEMRIGINTGQVVAGSSTTRQSMVSGEVVNVAARLEQNAAAGEILIGPDTLRAAGPGVRTAETGPLLLKGKSDRVTAHRLLGLDEEDSPEALRRFDLGFVGRSHELALLDRALDRVVRARQAGRLVFSGEAGQGKTRLLREWLDLETASPGGLRHGFGRCRSRGEQASLGPLADAVAAALKAGGRLTPSPELELLNHGLLLDGTPNPSLTDTCAALAKVLTQLSGTGPVVLVIDDCHWAAQPLFDALDQLVRALTGAAVLVVLLTRPQLLDVRPGLASDAVPLGGLSDEEARLLATELTGFASNGEPLPPELLERAGGNPLHLEQLLITGDGVGTDSVPLPLQALIGARIDALDPPEHRALGLASVLGRDFTAEELTALADTSVPPVVPSSAFTGAPPTLAGPSSAHTGPPPTLASSPLESGAHAELRATLHRLVRHRLVTPDGRSFRFAGGLIQEVVYDCQSKQDRAERHERAALLASVREAGGAAVGAHLEQAHRYRVELGAQDAHTDELRRRAADALADAGRLALAHADPVWAADLLSRATARYEPGEPNSTATRRRLGQTLLDLGRAAEGQALLEEVLAGAPAANGDGAFGGAVVEAAHARLALASAGRFAGPAESPAEAARATLPVFEAAHDDLGQARACLRLAQARQEEGRHGDAERLLARALAHAVRDDAEPERAAALGATGVSLWCGPRPVAQAVAQCRDLLTDQGPGRRAVRLTLNCPLAVLLALHDDEDGALACLAEAEHLAKGLGYAEADAFLPIFAATVADLAGRREEALLTLDGAAAAARELGASGLRRRAVLDATRIRLDLGDWRTASADLADLEGVREDGGGTGESDRTRTGGGDRTRTGGDRTRGADGTGGGPGRAEDGEHSDPRRPNADSADLDGMRARIAAARGDAATATRLAARALATADLTDSPIVQGTAALDLARTALALGRPAHAAEATALARRRFAAKGHLPAVRRADAMADLCRGFPAGHGPRRGADNVAAETAETARETVR